MTTWEPPCSSSLHGLLYNGCDNAAGAQTERRGGAGPVRFLECPYGALLGGKDLTGRFFFQESGIRSQQNQIGS